MVEGARRVRPRPRAVEGIAAGMLKFSWMAVVVMTMSSALIGIGASNLLRQPPPAAASPALTREPIAECIQAGGTWQEREGTTYCTPPKAEVGRPAVLTRAFSIGAMQCHERGGQWASNPMQPLGEGVCVFLDGGDVSGPAR